MDGRLLAGVNICSMRVISVFSFCLFLSLANAQPYLKAKEKVAGKRYSYYFMKPNQVGKGLVLLMPSRGETAKKVFWHSAIPRHLAERGFITIVPDVDYALTLEDVTRKIIDHLIDAESAKNGLVNAPLFVGGFSSGGAIAACYAEYKLSEDANSLAGVFLIDPPMNLERFYNAWVPLISSGCPDVIIEEGAFIKKYIERLTGGNPTKARSHYLKYSAFMATDSLGGNAVFLRTVPIRLYTEPDLDAMRSKYCNDLTYQNLNASDLDSLYERLIKLGNTHVEYIKTSGRGLHSWNIVEPENLAVWVEKVIERR